jgi:hypothetical protein
MPRGSCSLHVYILTGTCNVPQIPTFACFIFIRTDNVLHFQAFLHFHLNTNGALHFLAFCSFSSFTSLNVPRKPMSLGNQCPSIESPRCHQCPSEKKGSSETIIPQFNNHFVATNNFVATNHIVATNHFVTTNVPRKPLALSSITLLPPMSLGSQWPSVQSPRCHQ